MGRPRDKSVGVMGRQFSTAKSEVCVEKPPVDTTLTTGASWASRRWIVMTLDRCNHARQAHGHWAAEPRAGCWQRCWGIINSRKHNSFRPRPRKLKVSESECSCSNFRKRSSSGCRSTAQTCGSPDTWKRASTALELRVNLDMLCSLARSSLSQHSFSSHKKGAI